jgi:hypothetical protein
MARRRIGHDAAGHRGMLGLGTVLIGELPRRKARAT